MSDEWPSNERLNTYFERVCECDHVGVLQFLESVLDPLIEHLRRWRSDVDPHLCITAAEDTLLALIRKPTIYDPQRGSIVGFLRMSAERDLLNALQKESRHHRQREQIDCVELASLTRKESLEETPSFDDPELVAVIANFTPQERAVLELWKSGERKTVVFAAAMEISDWPAAEQASEVKRTKDRIFKRLQRTRELS